MLSQYLSSMIASGFVIASCILNALLTWRYTPSPVAERTPRPRKAVFVRIVSALVITGFVAAILRVFEVMPSWQACIVWAACPILVALRDDKLWIKAALVGNFVVAGLFVISFPSVIAVYLVWFMPMLALAGCLPRLMIGLQSLTGRKQDWLMRVLPWIFLLIAAPFADTALMKYGASDLISLSFEWGLSDRFVFWANNPWPDVAELVLYSLPIDHVGVITAYVAFGFFGVMALQARVTRDVGKIGMPLGMLVTGLFIYHVLSWLIGPFGFVHLTSFIIVGSQLFAVLLILVTADRQGRVLPENS